MGYDFMNFRFFLRTNIVLMLLIVCPALMSDAPEIQTSLELSNGREVSFDKIFYERNLPLRKEIEDELKQKLQLEDKILKIDEKKKLDNDITTIHCGYQTIYKILSKTDHAFEHKDHAVLLGEETFRHLRILSGDQGSPEKSIWSKLDRANTHFGSAVLAKMLSTPTTNLDLLKSRQAILKKLLEDEEFFDSLEVLSKNIKSIQDDLLGILSIDPVADYSNILHSTGFLNLCKLDGKSFLGAINRNVIANNAICGARLSAQMFLFMSVVPVYAILAYLAYQKRSAIGDFFSISNLKSLLKASPSAIRDLISGIRTNSFKVNAVAAGFLSLYSSLLISEVIMLGCIPFLIYKSICNWITAIQKSFKQSGSMRKLFDNYKKLSAIVNNLDPETQKALNLFQISAEDLEKKINKNLRWLSKNLSKTKTPGGFLKAYKMIYELRAEMGYILASIGQIDAFLSMAKLYKELSAKKKGLCFAQFIDSDVPKIKAQEAWDFSLDACVAVPSNFELGGGDDFHNGILTGPNTAGKSTFMRSAFLNILLAQTFGLGCAHSLELTLFHGLFSYMNVVDNISKGMSQFYSEAHTVTQALNRIKDLAKEGKTSFFMVDEMFSGTNPEDARSILQGIVESACKIDKSIWIVSTHLTGAASAIIEQTKGNFGGLMVNNFVGADGKVVFDHRIVPGVSTTSTAFDVIADVGLDMEIVERARVIREGLSR